MKQIIKKPTHAEATLGKVYTNMGAFYVQPLSGAPCGHIWPLCCVVPATSQPGVCCSQMHKQGPIQEDACMMALSEAQWESLYHANSCVEQFIMFLSAISDLMDTHASPIHTEEVLQQ